MFRRERGLSTLGSSSNDEDLLDWYPSQVKGPVDDEVQEGKIISPIKLFSTLFLFLQLILSQLSNLTKMENYSRLVTKAVELLCFNVNK